MALSALLEHEQADLGIERALSAAGAGASDRQDLAERHDDYLADSWTP
jgi:hypothetical protein